MRNFSDYFLVSPAFLKPWVAKTMRMGRDPNVGRQGYAEWSQKLVNYRT